MDEQFYDIDFYQTQIKQMEERYALQFKKWKLSWEKYHEYVKSHMSVKINWMWEFLCGFEKFLQQEATNTKVGRKERLYKDAKNRIARIIGNHYKIESYIKSL